MADISASSSEPLATIIISPSLVEKQLVKALKQSTTSAEVVEELRPESGRIVPRKFRVDTLIVLSNDVWSIHKMQRKSDLIIWLSNTWSRVGDVPNDHL